MRYGIRLDVGTDARPRSWYWLNFVTDMYESLWFDKLLVTSFIATCFIETGDRWRHYKKNEHSSNTLVSDAFSSGTNIQN